ncbi:MAG: PE-PPE domain-containing protein [Mycobacterium sp.]
MDTPEGFYPTTGVNSLTAGASEAQGAKILDQAILSQIAGGHVDADNPVVVFGYSQSSALSTLTMQQLHDQGMPGDDVHFVLVGDTAAPNGGLLTALVRGAQQGVQAAVNDLADPANYQVTSILDNPVLSPLVDAAYTSGLTDTLQPTLSELSQALLGSNSFPNSDVTLHSPLPDIINDITATVSADEAALLPIQDTITTLTTTLPAYGANIFLDQLEAGNLLGAIGDPIAADTALVSFAIVLGAGALSSAIQGTMLNLTTLFS